MARFLVFWVFCGRFMEAEIKDGEFTDDQRQSLIINEFDQSSGFYQLFPVEKSILDLSKRLFNSYHIGIFCGQSEAVKKYSADQIFQNIDSEPTNQVQKSQQEESELTQDKNEELQFSKEE